MNSGSELVHELSGKSDRSRVHQALQSGRSNSNRAGLRSSEMIRAPQIFDIGGEETGVSGDLLYNQHKLTDDTSCSYEEFAMDMLMAEREEEQGRDFDPHECDDTSRVDEEYDGKSGESSSADDDDDYDGDVCMSEEDDLSIVV